MTSVLLTYLGISLTVSLVVIALLLLSPLLGRRYAAKWKYLIWIFLAVRLLIPVSGIYRRSAPASAPAENIGYAQIEQQAQAETQVQAAPQRQRIVFEIPAQAAEPIIVTQTEKADIDISLLDIAAALWIIGALVYISVHMLSYAHCKRLIKRDGKTVTDESISEMVKKLSKELDLHRAIPVVRYAQAASPMIIGFFKPVLVLPDDDFSDKELYFILRHELIHRKRRDVWFKLLFVLANAVHWFNPMIWIMQKEAVVDMELSCDEGVITGADFDARKEYTETLLSTIKGKGVNRSALSTQFYGGKKTMKKRFKNILSRINKKNGSVILVCAIVLAIGLGALVGCSVKASPDELTDDEQGFNFDMIEIPDIPDDGMSTVWQLNQHGAEKTLLSAKQPSDYVFYLLTEHTRTDSANYPDVIFANDVSVGIGRDYGTISDEHTVSAVTQGAQNLSGYRLYKDRISEYITVYDFGQGRYIVVFRLFENHDDTAAKGLFFSVVNDELYMLMGDFSAVGGALADVVAYLGQNLIQNKEGNALFDADTGINYTFNFDNIGASPEYEGPHFTAEAAEGSSVASHGGISVEEATRLIDDYMRFERYTLYSHLWFDAFNPTDGVRIDDTYYFRVTEEGLTTWQEWSDFIHGIFIDAVAETELENAPYINVDGGLYTPDIGGKGWGVSGLYFAAAESYGDTAVAEFWRENLMEDEEGTYRITVLNLVYTDAGWRVESVETHESTDSDYEPIMSNPDIPEGVEVDEETTALANEILLDMQEDRITVHNLLAGGMLENETVEINGSLYLPFAAPYDTVDYNMEIIRRVYTDKKSEQIKQDYFINNLNIIEVDGKLYHTLSDAPYSPFRIPVPYAIRVSEDEIAAMTFVDHDDGRNAYVITLKNEKGVWKIDSMTDDGRERDY